MTEKNKFKIELKYLAFLILVAVISCFSVAGATLSRYITQTDAYFNDGEEIHEYLDFTVNSVFEVKNQMELFAAINQGYSFIRLSQDIENPLIVTQKAETLDSDLILDLNGVEIQRNGYEPILNVKDGVRLTVVDTSDEGTGGLYNPVGSVFNITGGTLTIATGHFESGPRYSEYYSYNTDVIDGNDENNKRTIVLPEEKLVHFHKATITDGKYSYGDAQQINAPIIRSYPLDVGNVTYTHGNLYFDHEYLADEDGDGVRDANEFYIPVDTYCYYRTSEDAINGRLEMIELTCDWYYMYWVDLDFNYAFAELPADADVDQYIEIAIYGYEKVIEDAAAISNQADYYAAIQMSKGTLEVQDGEFFSYFGVPTTACVNALGGEIDIIKGKFSSRIPNATITVNPNVTTDKIAKKHDDVDAFGDDYFEKYNWNDTLYTDGNGAQKTLGALAMAGESYCILNSGNAAVSIDNGQFYSSNNNNVHMGGGSLTVGGGSFAKRQNYKIATDSPTAIGDKTACVYMAEGTLDVGEAKYDITGEYNIGIYMVNGRLDVHDADCTISGDYTYGVYMVNGTLEIDTAQFTIKGNNTYGVYSTVSGDDSFKLNNASFALIEGQFQKGIYAENGRVQLTSDANQSISLSGANGYGIFVQNDGSVLSDGYDYSIGGGNSTGIYSTNGTGSVSNGGITINGTNSYGINSQNGDITLENGSIDIAGQNSMGIYSQNATITMTNGDISISGATSDGIHSETGAISFTDGNVTLTGNNSNGIYSTNATITMQDGTVSLTGTQSKGVYSTGGNITMTGGGITLDSNQTCYGIYAASDNAMSIILDDANVSVGFDDNTARTNTVDATVGVFLETAKKDNKITLINADVKSYEIGILLRGGSLDVKGTGQLAEIATKKASSIVVLDGNLTFDSSCNYNITSSTTRNNAITNSYTVQLPTTKGADKTYANTDGVYVSGGNFESNGTTNITHTGLYNNTSTWQVYTDIQMTSFAVRILGGSVLINKGAITNSVGGGLCCNGGNVTLGNTDSTLTDIRITTTGKTNTGNLWDPIGAYGDESWQRYRTSDGGNAVEINGGSLIAYNGTYRAAFGDGIVLKVPGGGSATVDIYGGDYYAGMTQASRSGPGACYGVKVYGSATINIYDGRFDGIGGGACVAGVYDYEYTNGQRIISYDANNPANVYIYKGTFGSSTARDGFMIYDYANIIFGAGDEEYLQQYIDQGIAPIDLIDIESELAPFSVNWITYNAPAEPKSSNIEVYYGNYDNDCDYAGWNKSGAASAVQFYNFNQGLATYNTDGGYQEAVNNIRNGTVEYYEKP